ncbi:MAG: dynamin family protein [Candidatus Brocadiae bacterium]|nr:dynamin family protein [Candidatus Brocadiia bacterium]
MYIDEKISDTAIFHNLYDSVSSTFALLEGKNDFSPSLDIFNHDPSCSLPLIAFVGEFKRGKSSLVKALCNLELSYKGKDHVVILCHPDNKDSRQVQELCSIGLKISVMESTSPICSHAIVLDTPGLNDPAIPDNPFLFSLLTRCDRIFMVLSVEQPLSISEKKFIARLLQEQRQKLALILHKCDILSSMEEFSEIQKRILHQISFWLPNPILLPTSRHANISCPAVSGMENFFTFLQRDLVQIDKTNQIKKANHLEWKLLNIETQLSIEEQSLTLKKMGETKLLEKQSLILLERQKKLEKDIEEIFQNLEIILPEYSQREIEKSNAYLVSCFKQLSDIQDKKEVSRILEQETEQLIDKIFQNLLISLQEQHEKQEISTKALSLAKEAYNLPVSDNCIREKKQETKSMLSGFMQKALETLIGTTLESSGPVVLWMKKAWDCYWDWKKKKEQKNLAEEMAMVYCHEIQGQIQDHFHKVLEQMKNTELSFFRKEFLEQKLNPQNTSCELEAEIAKCSSLRQRVNKTLNLLYQWKQTILS